MHTRAAETAHTSRHMEIQAANDTVTPIRDYFIPIPPHKHPPTGDDFDQKKQRRERQPEAETEVHKPAVPPGEGHVDDFA